MKIILYPGSFNPITNAHINIANTALQKLNADKIIFIPANDSYVAKKDTLISGPIRCKLIEDIDCTLCDKKEVSYIEISGFDKYGNWNTYADTPPKTYNTVNLIKKLNPNNIYYICIGIDNLQSLRTWYNWKTFIKNNKFIVFKRNGISLIDALYSFDLYEYKNNFIELEIEPNNISSSLVRNNCKLHKFDDIKNIVPNNVYNYLLEFYNTK